MTLRDVCVLVRNRFCCLPVEKQMEWLHEEWGLDVHPMTEFNKFCEKKFHGDYWRAVHEATISTKFNYTDPWFAWSEDDAEFVSAMSPFEITTKEDNVTLLFDVSYNSERFDMLGFTEDEKKEITMHLKICDDDDKRKEAWDSMRDGY